MEQIQYEPHTVTDLSKPYIFHPATCGCFAHWHGDVEILCFPCDRDVVCERTEYRVKAGDLFVINSNALHAISIHPGKPYECLIIDSKFAENNDLPLTVLRFDEIVRDAESLRLFAAVREAIGSQEPFAAGAAKAAILALAVHLCRHHSHPVPEHHAHRDSVRQAIGYIHSHYAGPITIDELAAFVKVSKYYFCREFRRETGCTVVQYINNLRCREAERMLRGGLCTVGEAARLCGFENQSYFTRTFKSVTGVRPIDVRR